MNIRHQHIIKFCFLLLLPVLLNNTMAQTDRESSSKGSFTTPGNKPPEPFNLLTPEDGSKELILDVMFTWEEAKDPEGKEVTYLFLLSDKPEFDNSIIHRQPDLTAPFAILSFRNVSTLSPGVTYYWKVIAFDGEGGSTESNQVFQFSLAQLTGNITLQVQVISLQTRSILQSATVNAKYQAGGDVFFPEPVAGVWFAVINGAGFLDITASAANYASETITNYDIASASPFNPQEVEIGLKCINCDVIFSNQYENQ